jgi:hypothetical protein
MSAQSRLVAGRLRIGRALLAAAAPALLILGPASARMAHYGGTLVVALPGGIPARSIQRSVAATAGGP